MSPGIKYIFAYKKKGNVLLNKKVIFVFHMIFKLDFITQAIYCIIHRCLYSLFILFVLLSVSKKPNIERMLTLPYSYNWQKFDNKTNEKRSQEYQMQALNMQLGKLIVVLKILICYSLIKRFSNNHKRYSRHLQVSMLHRVAPIEVYLDFMRALKTAI